LRSSGLFDRLFVPEAHREVCSDRAWLQAMLDFEAGLTRAEARAGLIPEEAADAIATACHADRFDPGALGSEGRAAGNPVPPLVRSLTEAAGNKAGGYVHLGATSQDVLDTAAMLIACRARERIDGELQGVVSACARLARDHRGTAMAGRTLLQHASPRRRSPSSSAAPRARSPRSAGMACACCRCWPANSGSVRSCSRTAR
jgi:3-carboxy-cis,cis-muconate cycloisomerase